MYELEFQKSALKTLRRMDRKVAGRVRLELDKLAGDPDRVDLDVKKLVGREGYRLRVGVYRVIFSRHENGDIRVLVIQRIAPRGSAYGP